MLLVVASSPPDPATPLDVLLALEAIDADPQGEKTRRKLDVLSVFAMSVHDVAQAATLDACRKTGLKVH